MPIARRPNRLPDRIRPGLRVLFVGINPGIRSAAVGHHFAGFSNRFWRLLHDSGLVPRPLGWKDDRRLPEWGFGITNLVPRPTRGIEELRPREYLAGRRALFAKVRRYRPRVVALVGITIYRALFPARPRGDLRPARAKAPRRVLPGLSTETIEGRPVFVLPNPSGRNATLSYDEMLAAFRSLARFVPSGRRRPRRRVTSPPVSVPRPAKG
jgi:TDG/mug DNA glycosylase family protein